MKAVVPNSGVFVSPRNHEASLAQPPRDGHVEVGNVFGVGVARVGRADAGGRRQVLDRDRDTAERRISLGFVGRAGVGERILSAHGDEGIESRIESRDAIEVQLHELEGRDLPRAYQSRLLDGGEERKLHADEATTSSREARNENRTRSVPSAQWTNGEGRNRTGDTTVFSRVLYRLSYLAVGGAV